MNKNQLLKSLLVFFVVSLCASRILFAQVTYTVTSAADDNSNTTLRKAITQLNANGSSTQMNTINFAIGGGGGAPETINLTSALPVITKPVRINGYTQGGSATSGTGPIGSRTIYIQINANNVSGGGAIFELGPGASGVGSTTTTRTAISGFALYNTGINMACFLVDPGISHVQIWGNHIGTYANGVLAQLNRGDGIILGDYGVSPTGTYSDIVIGKDLTTGSTDNIEGNIISNNNGSSTLAVDGASGISLGAFNAVGGSTVSTYTFTNVNISGNYIGVNANGAAAPNGPLGAPSSTTVWRGEGIEVYQAAAGSSITIGSNGDNNGDALERNIISGNLGNGIALDNNGPISNVSIGGNYIGTNIAGTASVPNAGYSSASVGYYDGILNTNTTSSNILIGVTSAAANPTALRNVVSGNTGGGIYLGNIGTSGSVIIAGNYIGVDASGNTVLGNGTGGTNTDGASDGIAIANCLGTSGHTSVLIGTNADGNQDALETNVVSGNRNRGVDIYGGSQYTVVAGNYIGVGANATTAIGNGWSGVNIGNTNGTNTTSNNRVGSNDDGTNDNVEGNIIANNGNISSSAGLGIPAGNNIQNRISRNNFYGNTTLPIDLKYDHTVNLNAGNTTAGQANILMNYPVFTSQSVVTGSGTNVTQVHVRGYVGNSSATNGPLYAGTSNTITGTITIQLYKLMNDGNQNGGVSTASPAPSNYPHGEGTYVGSFQFTADGVSNIFDASANVTGLTTSDQLTGIAIDANGNTSEFGVFPSPGQALPVTLDNFLVKSVNCEAIISWTGAVENNFKYYEVQQSLDGSNFTTVQQIPGKGSGSNYTAQFALNANNEYVRLKMVDNSDAFTYSDILPVKSSCATNMTPAAYPNPVSGQLTLSNLGMGIKEIQIISINGVSVYTVQTSALQLNIGTQNWSSGVYLVSVKNEDGSMVTIKVVKK